MRARLFLRLAAIMIVIMGGFSSCSERKEVHVDEGCPFVFHIVHDEFASIIGKWKLVSEITSRIVTCTDYSQYDIVYEFKANGVLTVSAKPGTPEMWPETGKLHVYSFFEDYDHVRRLQIDNSDFWYRISSGSKELIIDKAPVDGATQYFIKIQ